MNTYWRSQIVNPLLSGNIPPHLVAIPPNIQQTPVPNTSMLAASNIPLNSAYPQPGPSKSRRMRPTKSVTARYTISFITLTNVRLIFCLIFYIHRNLCAIDWCKENKGTADDFNKFWNNLPKNDKEVSKFRFYVFGTLTGFSEIRSSIQRAFSTTRTGKHIYLVYSSFHIPASRHTIAISITATILFVGRQTYLGTIDLRLHNIYAICFNFSPFVLI